MRTNNIRGRARATASVVGAVVAACVLACSPPSARRPETSDIEWPAYGGDAGGSRFSSATQIDRRNVVSLRAAWTFATGPTSVEAITNPKEGNTPNHEATPIVVDGRMYVSTPLGRVFALDPASGRVFWIFDAQIDVTGNYGDNANRGVAVWLDSAAAAADACRRRVFIATIDARLIALDAENGKRCENFGGHGTVNLIAGLRNPPEYLGEYEETSPPTVVNGIVIVGSGIADNNRANAPSGVVRGYDARTGALRWSWDPVPQDSTDPGWATWTGPHAHEAGAANAWSVMAADPSRDLVFVPTGSPSTDYYGGLRLGTNLYANSIIALHATTGTPAWHFQLVHHDLWDYDVAAPPLLADAAIDGKRIPVAIQIGKTAQLFVLNRVTGAPVLPVDERRVPPSDVPGEIAAPTQPVSSAFGSLVPEDVLAQLPTNLSPAESASCHKQIAALRHVGPFTPPSLQGTLYLPSNIGGAQWGGLAYDPARNIVVVPMNRIATALQLIPRAAYDSTREEKGWQYTGMAGTPYVMRRRVLTTDSGLPCTRPPFASLVAINLSTKKKIWEVPLGDASRSPIARKRDAATPASWGTSVLGGPIVTAGGLVFIAGTNDSSIRGFDIDTGAELWRGELDGRGKATPMTYYLGATGKQYLVVSVGGGSLRGKGASVTAFALP
jgi:quinoprotein glucose dehydrogenase